MGSEEVEHGKLWVRYVNGSWGVRRWEMGSEGLVSGWGKGDEIVGHGVGHGVV